MKKRALTLTVVADMTANYSESMGNVGSVQKVYREGKTYADRSKESLKQGLMEISGLYDDVVTQMDTKVAQKMIAQDVNAATKRSLEAGYMSTTGVRGKRNSSFYLTDAVACDEFVNEIRFHTNLSLASKYAKQEGLDMFTKDEKTGLNPFQYEFSKGLKKYSITIDLEKIGVDENFDMEATPEEKAKRVELLLDGVAHLTLTVRGSLDNAEPIFVVGGLSEYKTHSFDNMVAVKKGSLKITPELKERVTTNGYSCALLHGVGIENEDEVDRELNPKTVDTFFKDLKTEVRKYYGV